MTQVNIATINTEIETTIRDWSTSTVKTDLARIKRTDTLRSAGWASTHCISPKSEGSEATDEGWAFLKDTINSGLPKGAQDMMAMSAKVCGDKTVNGQSRAYWMRQANAVIGDIKTQLKRREDIASEVASGKTGPDARTVSAETKVRELLNDAIKRMQKSDTFESKMDVGAMVEALNMMIKSIG